MQICKNHKQDKSHSQPPNVNLTHRFKFTIAFFIIKNIDKFAFLVRKSVVKVTEACLKFTGFFAAKFYEVGDFCIRKNDKTL